LDIAVEKGGQVLLHLEANLCESWAAGAK
jgi:hypothetical protein